MKSRMKKHLSAQGLLKIARYKFAKIDDAIGKSHGISLVDCLMSGLAIFGMKFASLLQFDLNRSEACIRHNLKTLYEVDKVPCDTYLRERLDEVEPKLLQRTLKSIFACLQRGKVLEGYVYHQGHYLMSLDGTGCFSSHEIHCSSCCIKEHHDGTTTYYHQVLSGVLVHPEESPVLPLIVEPVVQQDGKAKNDCELNAAKRLVPQLKAMHPHLKLIVLGDALFANQPFLTLLKEHGYSFILSVTPKGHTYLFEFLKTIKAPLKEQRIDGTTYRYRWITAVPLNDSHPDVLVNLLDCEEISPKGKIQRFSKITNLPITQDNVHQLMKGGRARWKIENETFNTLKNQGYHFEHNFGHGKRYLHTVFTYLMFLAFLIDQAQGIACDFFKRALKKAKNNKRYFWQKMRNFFTDYFIISWEDLYNVIAHGQHQPGYLKPDTS